eukprot:6186846-Pleurochrysis_carterae.AAC.4
MAVLKPLRRRETDTLTHSLLEAQCSLTALSSSSQPACVCTPGPLGLRQCGSVKRRNVAVREKFLRHCLVAKSFLLWFFASHVRYKIILHRGSDGRLGMKTSAMNSAVSANLQVNRAKMENRVFIYNGFLTFT